MQKVDVSICIVAYKAPKELNECLQSIYKQKKVGTLEVIVVDHNENEKMVQRVLSAFPTVIYVRPLTNGGYGAGNNRAIEIAKGEFVFIMNPDTKFESDLALSYLLRFLKTHPKAAGVSGLLLEETGKPYTQLGASELTPLKGIVALSFLNKLFPKNKISQSYYVPIHEKKPTRVAALPGSAALFRKSALAAVGGFDEQLFLYFEEHDVGRRLLKKKWELWIEPKARVIHGWGKSTNAVRQEKLRGIFNRSRFYYFKKHFGIVSASLVEAFARFGKHEAMLLIVFLLGLFLRFYNLPSNIIFHGELGDNYLAMKNIFETGNIPLLGPPTSHTWLSFGPLFYWFFAPLLLLSKYEPLGMALVFAGIGGVTILVHYLFVSRMFSKKAALLSAFLIAISPAYLDFTRESRFFSVTLLLFYPFYYSLVTARYFMAGVWFGVLLNFHLTPIIYIPAVALFLLKRRNTFVRSLASLLLGVTVSSLPFILYNALHGFQMVGNMLLWIPYRIGGFFGLVPKNQFSPDIAITNVTSALDFVYGAILPLKSQTPLLLSALCLGLLLILIAYRRVHKKNNSFWLLITMLITGYLAVFIHGNPPSHYYLPLYPVLLISIAVAALHVFARMRVVLFILLLIITVVNIRYYFSDQWFYKQNEYFTTTATVPYVLQTDASHAIVEDAQGTSFSLKRVGPFDQFEENYSQNYRYLLWKAGNEPRPNAYLTYAIYEGREPLAHETVIYSKGGIIVTKAYALTNGY